MNGPRAAVYELVMLRQTFTVCATLLLLACTLHAVRGLPEPVIPQGFGVNIHFVRPDEAEVEKLAGVGYQFIRMDFTWGAIERRRGEYDFAGYDALVESMSKRGIRILFILDYGNRLYDDGRAPHSDEARAAFAKWAGAAARRYAGRDILWEIWNEPNLAQFWKPGPSVEDYCKLAHETIDAIRAADPQAFIMGPASSGFPWEFLETMANRGVLAKLDAVSVHPYRQKPPETAVADYRRLRELIDKAVPDKRLPIVSGEWGYSTGWKNHTEQMQAQYLVRQWLFNLANGVNLSIWYDWRDDGLDPKEAEHHFGSVYRDFRDKPASIAARTLCDTLRGYRFVRRLATEKDSDWVLLLDRQGETAIAAWTTAEAHAVTIDLVKGKMQQIDMAGGRQVIEAGANGLRLELSASPHYLLLLQ